MGLSIRLNVMHSERAASIDYLVIWASICNLQSAFQPPFRHCFPKLALTSFAINCRWNRVFVSQYMLTLTIQSNQLLIICKMFFISSYQLSAISLPWNEAKWDKVHHYSLCVRQRMPTDLIFLGINWFSLMEATSNKIIIDEHSSQASGRVFQKRFQSVPNCRTTFKLFHQKLSRCWYSQILCGSPSPGQVDFKS